jgi:Ca2+-binding EF-hand superfamily protein
MEFAQKFDQNSDGLLSVEELSESDGISEEIVAGLFEVADSNGDGRISREEFGRVADTIESHISQVI